MDNNILGLIFGLAFAFIGFLLFYGAYKRWKFLVDPPAKLWPFYTQSFMKKIDGPEGARSWVLFVGTISFCAGLYFAWVCFKNLVR